jgi:hypothetical protein
MSTNLLKVIIDASTGQITERDLTAAEIKEQQTAAAEYAASKTAEEKTVADKTKAKAALFAKLGITEEEAALLA